MKFITTVGRVEKNCEYCQVSFLAWPSENARFCSRACYNLGRDPQPITLHILLCQECNTLYSVPKHRADVSKCCSRMCTQKYIGKKNSGVNHYRWKGGNSIRSGAIQKLIAKLKKERGCCDNCGVTENLHGHHKLPYANYPDLREESTNIMILCADCHALQHPELKNLLSTKKEKSGEFIECVVCDELYYRYKSHKNRTKCCSVVCANIYKTKDFKAMRVAS